MNIIESNIANLPTKYGNFRIKAYKDGNQEHLAIMSLDFETLEAPFVRIHSECLTGDTLGSLKCDCQNQLDLSLKFIAKNGGNFQGVPVTDICGEIILGFDRPKLQDALRKNGLIAD
jgi:GTP cyclohydrolase II